MLGVVIVAAVAGGGVYLATRSSGSSATAATVQRSVTLQPIAVRNLVATASYDGTLDYANQRPIYAAAASTASSATSATAAGGIVTSVLPAGSLVRRGGVLFSVNNTPTVLLYGSFPMYRTLQSGVSDGLDIQQLKQNLQRLGYASTYMTIDRTWDGYLTAAVDAWEAALGLTQDATVPVSRVVFSRGPVLIYNAAAVGDTASASVPVVTISSTQRAATVSMTVSNATIVSVNDRPRVTLPSGAAVRGQVTAISAAATTPASSSGSGSSSSGGATNQSGASTTTSSATVTVTISLPNARALAALTTAPVTVAFTQQRATHVLSVPTTALVTLADGTFAVEVSDGNGKTHYVRVTPGLFAAGGYVQISGDVRVGEQVVVPQ